MCIDFVFKPYASLGRRSWGNEFGISRLRSINPIVQWTTTWHEHSYFQQLTWDWWVSFILFFFIIHLLSLCLRSLATMYSWEDLMAKILSANSSISTCKGSIFTTGRGLDVVLLVHVLSIPSEDFSWIRVLKLTVLEPSAFFSFEKQNLYLPFSGAVIV